MTHRIIPLVLWSDQRAVQEFVCLGCDKPVLRNAGTFPNQRWQHRNDGRRTERWAPRKAA